MEPSLYGHPVEELPNFTAILLCYKRKLPINYTNGRDLTSNCHKSFKSVHISVESLDSNFTFSHKWNL